jgi:hypothetical protein
MEISTFQKTKILATIGPASNNYEILLELVKSGVVNLDSWRLSTLRLDDFFPTELTRNPGKYGYTIEENTTTKRRAWKNDLMTSVEADVLAAKHVAVLGAPPLEPTTPEFTEFIDTSEPLAKRAIFLALFVNP